ncbi:MAG: MlaD family protein, partial [Solirubrobacteraceae bacterium]|nr:MlaD family protein [Solirubrobacteraceae bacterium]
MIRPIDTSARTARRLAGVAALCATTIFAAGCGGDSNGNAYTVRAIFSSASFVQKGLDVRIAGVTVGAVDGVTLTDDNRAAVTFTITDAGFPDLRQDATCTIRPQALIGERYLECMLTEPRPSGATAPPKLAAIANGPFKGEYLLPETQTVVPVDSDELLNVNTASVRDRFGIIIRELGVGVAGRGDEIATALRKGNEGLTYANRILKQLDDDTEMLKGLVSSSDQTLAVLSDERDAVSGTIENGAVVARRLAARKNEVKA